MRSYEDFWLVTRAALEFSLASIGSAPAAALCDRLMGSYLHLDLYEEVVRALALLGDYKLAMLSNGSPSQSLPVMRSGQLARPHRLDTATASAVAPCVAERARFAGECLRHVLAFYHVATPARTGASCCQRDDCVLLMPSSS